MAQALENRLRPVNTPGARVPPHNLEAEESLLGAMLLNRDAVASALECCKAEDFYKPAHGHIFTAITSLYSRGEEVDVVTVTNELRRTGVLEAIGDASVLLSLSANTPSLGNSGAYARIVEEHSLLRGLISVAGEIAELGYSLPEDVSEVIDEAERKVFEVAERRVVESMSPLRELLSQTLDHLEHLYERGESVTGVPTGYVDLDERLAGLQKSNLVVVGARPAMGKALALETPVPVPGGWTSMGELVPGDEVFDEAGRPCRVTYTSPVFLGHRCYRVCFDDGSEVVADAGHRWLAYDLPAWQAHRALALQAAPTGAGDPRPRAWRALPQVVTTEDMVRQGVRTGAGRPRWYVPLAAPLELPESELPVDPYRLGRHLAESAREGTPARVPERYVRAAFKDRLELVSGLLDGAGDPRGLPGSRRPELHLPDRFLVEQAREVLCSLGLKPTAVRRHVPAPGAGPAPTWSVAWDRRDGQRSVPTGRRLSAALALRVGGRHRRRAVLAVEEVPSVPVRCIAVDSPSRLFLAGRSMVPTHNTSFALGIVAHAAVHARVPVLLFSLEMSHLELSQRLLCSEARVDATRMRNGRLLEADWGKISEAIGRLGDAPIYIDDNPNVTVMDIRAKARRLKARQGLGLVVVDYLQLMSGHQRSRAENRQVEVSEISRGLKVLARELDIPVVALSQLSRNLEMRQDKRPVLADLRESGCLTADTRVLRADTGAEATMGELFESGAHDITVWALDDRLRMVPATMTHVFESGTKAVFELTLASGRSVRASANHPFRTALGWRRLDELEVGDRLATPRSLPKPSLPVSLAQDQVVGMALALAGQAASCADLAVPPAVWALHNEQLAEFLRALWTAGGELELSGRGRPRCRFSTGSRRLAADVQGLLLRFGIVAQVVSTRGGPGPVHRVQIRAESDLLQFLDEVGVMPERAPAAAVVRKHLLASSVDTGRDVVPSEMWQKIRDTLRRAGVNRHLLSAAMGWSFWERGRSRFEPTRPVVRQLAALVEDEDLRDMAESDVFWDEIVSIDRAGEEPVYDATVLDHHNFVANGVVAHNSIEQDSDVVMFIYRDELYNPESTQRGTAEIIIAKHRNGPTGSMSLAFMDHHTRFANMARV